MTAPKTPSSPPFAAIGACCASGATRRDPWTGEERCMFCGLPVPIQNTAGAALHGQESPDCANEYEEAAETVANQGGTPGRDFPVSAVVLEQIQATPEDFAERVRAYRYALAMKDAPDGDDPPLVMGGQGRDASEVEADAVGTVRLVVLAILSAGILALGVWAAGGGR